MGEVAAEFLSSLDEAQRSVARWSFPSEQERRLWFYTPTDHGGLTLHALEPSQQRLVMQLINAGLSGQAYATVATVMGLENVLDRVEGYSLSWGWPRARDPLRYFIRIFGDPSGEEWGWRFGGHHVSLNFTVRNGEIISGTPCFLGADPASTPLLGGHQLRPLAACEDLARDLLATFDDEQLSVAVVSPVPPVDLVGANRPFLTEGDGPLPLARVWRNEFTGELQDMVLAIQDKEEEKLGLTPAHIDAVRWSTTPKGLAVSRMDNSQQEVLQALIQTYIGRANDELAENAGRLVTEHLQSIHFAWAGSMDRGAAHYYRLHGPHLLAEYDNTTRDGNHVHTVWRDPVGDFGGDPLSAHLRQGHAG